MKLFFKNVMNTVYYIVFIFMFLFISYSSSNAFMTIVPRASKYIVGLTDETISNLAKIGKTKGRPALGDELAKYVKDVPEACRESYLESAYLKILVAQERLSKVKADEYLQNLSGVKGFINTMSKMSGKPHDLRGLPSSDPNTIGHGFELEFANALVKKQMYCI